MIKEFCAIFQFGYGEPLIRYQESMDNMIDDFRDASPLSPTIQDRPSIYYSPFRRRNRKGSGMEEKSCFQHLGYYLCRFWFCLSGNDRYKRALRRRASRFGINSRSRLDVFARIAFPLSFALFNILYWFYFLHFQR